jgi:hypothetical protein
MMLAFYEKHPTVVCGPMLPLDDEKGLPSASFYAIVKDERTIQ